MTTSITEFTQNAIWLTTSEDKEIEETISQPDPKFKNIFDKVKSTFKCYNKEVVDFPDLEDFSSDSDDQEINLGKYGKSINI